MCFWRLKEPNSRTKFDKIIELQTAKIDCLKTEDGNPELAAERP